MLGDRASAHPQTARVASVGDGWWGLKFGRQRAEVLPDASLHQSATAGGD